MKKWFKKFTWFLKTSCQFLDTNYLGVILRGGIIKAIYFANYMVKYDKLTHEQKQHLYLTENRVMEF